MNFEWDENKSRTNQKKHGIRFEEAQVIWADENSIEFLDPDHSFHEHRFIRLGMNPQRGVIFVAYCEREGGETVRIISARRANLIERSLYEGKL